MKEVWFNNYRFIRDDTTGYYLNSSIRKRLHRYVWEYHNGEIPEGYQIHHIDLDKSNNDISNLQLMTAEAHTELHRNLRVGICSEIQREHLTNIRELTKEWHSSDEGRLWHSQHYANSLGKMVEVELVCVCCGDKFSSVRSDARFCSNKCKSKHRRSTKKDYIEVKCEECGTVFLRNKYSKGVTCSRSCTNKLVWKKRKSDSFK